MARVVVYAVQFADMVREHEVDGDQVLPVDAAGITHGERVIFNGPEERAPYTVTKD